MTRLEIPGGVIVYAADPFVPKKKGDVGYDLYCYPVRENQTWLDRLVSWFMGEDVHVLMPVVGMRIISTMINLAMPDEFWCEIRARSSTSKKRVQVLGGTIDSGYTGELYVTLHNFGFIPRLVRKQDRFAQVVFFPALRPHPIYVLKETFEDIHKMRVEEGGRGSSGFGSTGK